MDDMGVTGDDGAEESPAAGGGFQTVFCGDVVFDDEGDAVEGAADVGFALGSFFVALFGDFEGVWIELYESTD